MMNADESGLAAVDELAPRFHTAAYSDDDRYVLRGAKAGIPTRVLAARLHISVQAVNQRFVAIHRRAGAPTATTAREGLVVYMAMVPAPAARLLSA
jgi:hypothetical protein